MFKFEASFIESAMTYPWVLLHWNSVFCLVNFACFTFCRTANPVFLSHVHSYSKIVSRRVKRVTWSHLSVVLPCPAPWGMVTLTCRLSSVFHHSKLKVCLQCLWSWQFLFFPLRTAGQSWLPKSFAVCVQGALERLWQSQCEASGMTVFSLLGEGDNDYSISSQHKVWRILSAQ